MKKLKKDKQEIIESPKPKTVIEVRDTVVDVLNRAEQACVVEYTRRYHELNDEFGYEMYPVLELSDQGIVGATQHVRKIKKVG